jgi:hypothetical protein
VAEACVYERNAIPDALDEVRAEERGNKKMPSTVRALVQALAEQSFMTHVLAKRLVELQILQRDELRSLFEYSEEKEDYIKNFTLQMTARGLHFD